MSDRRSFLDELRELDGATQAEQLRPGAVHRIARRLDAELLQAELPSRRRTWIPMVSFAAGAALVLAVFALDTDPQVATRVDTTPTPIHAAWQVGGDNCHVTRGEVELVLDGSCRVEPPRAGVVLESRATTRLRPIEGGVVLQGGTALIESMGAPDGTPFRVEVPGGVLELGATRLSVAVVEEAGHVDLLEGTMRFVGSDGLVHAVKPGERFRFGSAGPLAARVEPSDEPSDRGLAATAPEATAPEATAPEQPALAAGERLAALDRPETAGGRRGKARREAAPSSEELSRIVAQVADLRATRQYQAAVALLRDALRQRWDRRTREVLSYELGTILSTQLHDEPAACAHWATHRDQFPEGRYARAIERAQARLRCAAP